LLPIEANRCKSLRVAAVLRLLYALPIEELARQLARPGGVLDPATMSDRDLETLADELRRRLRRTA